MWDRYNCVSSPSSYHGSWIRSAALLQPFKGSIDERYVTDLPPPMSLPRAMNRHQNNDFRYNIPLKERFHQQKFNDVEEF